MRIGSKLRGGGPILSDGLEGSLKVRSRAAGSRFASISEILQKWAAGKTASGQSAATVEQDPQSRPFEHPYYWGGFV
jgi:hypothetical protein